MSSAQKPSRPTKSSSSSASSSLSSHLAMVELKQRVLTSLSKLSDRDTHQIAVEDLEKIIQTLNPDGVSMLLNCLCDAAAGDPKPAVKKESLRLIAALCDAHGDSTATHLTKIIAHVVKRLKDSDSGVRDACRDAIGALSGQYLKGEGGDNVGLGSVVSLFVKPLFEAMSEQNKGVQAGSAMCMAKMVDCASDPPVASFQKLCPRICKYLNNPNFLAKANLLQVVSSLSQVGAIAPQNLEALLQSIHECLGSTDWAIRKAAAETLIALALHSSNLIEDGASSTVTVLEACRLDKIKPVRDSMTEALQLWKKIAKGGDGASDDQKASSHDGESSEPAELSEKKDLKVPNHGDNKTETSAKNSSNGSSPTDLASKGKGSNILDKAVGILKKKASALTEKELNPEFFQRLETRGSGDLPVEVVVPRRCLNSANVQNDGESEPNDTDSRGRPKGNCQPDDGSVNIKSRFTERGTAGVFSRQRDLDEFARDKWAEERGNGKDSRTNWLAIQRQLLQLERQQAHLMNMLQDFMGGSHDSMVTLENRVRGLERVVEDMARDISMSSNRRGGNFMAGFEGSSNRPSGKYNGFPDYSGAKLGRSGDGWVPFGDRYAPSDGIGSYMRGRGASWRSDVSDAWDFHTYGKNGQMGSRRVLGGGSIDGRSPKSEHESDQVGGRRAWDKGTGPARLGEGPSARSVWQASKDEATLEAIRVAGEDNGTARNPRVAIPELTAEALGDDNSGPERDPVWTAWSNAMDALHVGDMDSAYAEVLSTGDDLLLVKLMDRSGAVVDQLSNEVASEVLHAVAEFLQDQNLFDICLSWIQQLVEIVGENGPDVLGIPTEVKRELLLNLHEACSAVDLPEDWEGATPDQLLLQLASAWGINLQQLEK
ncbi:Microtubule-associated protein [Actinidia chinensis var. chinensis]|uniref:Microtubule-associated protein n=1 Tax=Actinidia chinensis var. chinensis TaxID=1590841 RepID=A0A2R6PS88_ACTCC|nr:Microtubule-associated protein [Actinidia chinensis var. chinensis]